MRRLTVPTIAIGVAAVTALGLVLGLVVFDGSSAAPAAPDQAASDLTAEDTTATVSVTEAELRAQIDELIEQLETQGFGEGIQVHGNWQLDILEPDGTLVRHIEVDNALQTQGEEALVGFVSGEKRAGEWLIWLAETAGNVTTNPTITCEDSSECWTVANVSTTLQTGNSEMVLTSSVTMDVDGSLGHVATQVRSHDADTNTQQGNFWFSGTDVGPFPVAAGQIVQTTVTITFSS